MRDEDGTRDIRLSHPPAPGTAPGPAGLLGTGKLFPFGALLDDSHPPLLSCLAPPSIQSTRYGGIQWEIGLYLSDVIAPDPENLASTGQLTDWVTDRDAVRDEGLKRLLMSWYYAGYYTGYYEGQREQQQQQQDAESGQE